MQTLVLVVLSVWIFAESSVNGALNISFTGSNAPDSTTYTLQCDIPGFSGIAGWSRAGSPMTSCLPSGCFTTSSPPYTFRHDSSTIYVDFSTLAANEGGIQWTCEHVGDTSVDFNVQIFSPTIQTSTSLAKIERTTNINNIFEYNNVSTPMITGRITSMEDISASSIYFFTTKTTNRYANTESPNSHINNETNKSNAINEISNSYSNSETANLNAYIETTKCYVNTENRSTNFFVNTKNSETQTKISEILSNTLSTFEKTIVTPASNDISRSFFFQTMTEMLSSPVLSNNEIALVSTFQAHNSLSQTFSAFTYSVDTDIDNTFNSLIVSSDFPITAKSSRSSSLSLLLNPSHHLAPYGSTSLYESNILSAITEIYSFEKVVSRNSNVHTSVKPSETQHGSLNNIQGSTSDFQSKYIESYSQSNDGVLSSELSAYVLSFFQSASLLSINTKANATGVDSNIKPTNVLTFATKSSIHTNDPYRIQSYFSIQNMTILSTLKTTWLTTSINFNYTPASLFIKPSSQQSYIDYSYVEIETSFKHSLFSLDSYTAYFTSNDHDMKTLSSGVFKSIGTYPTSTLPSGLSEKNITMIFIGSTSVVLIVIFVILLIIVGKMYISKDDLKSRKEDHCVSWSNDSCSPNTSFPEFSSLGKNIHPMLNTATYDKNWNDVV